MFRILTGLPYGIHKQYSVGLRNASFGAILQGEAGRKIQKLQQPYQKGSCSRFSATKNHRLRTCRPLCFPHLSSSPDLRIFSSAQPSREIPNDRLSPHAEPPRIQWRYRPGFAPGFLFSCGAITTSAGTQTEYLLSMRVYTQKQKKSTPNPGVYIDFLQSSIFAFSLSAPTLRRPSSAK